MKGIFAVYKPKGITSHDVVGQIRQKTGVARVGHGGTLDPLASGVLVVAVGREHTKLLDQYVKGEKEYVATIKLGYESATGDEEGEKTEINSKKEPTLKDMKESIQKFIGSILQTPPLYSAKKVGGKSAYKYARKGKTVPLSPNQVNIFNIEIISYIYPILIIHVTTGPGVYIRSLARDIGQDLKTGAYLADLERTRVGQYTITDAISLNNISI